MEITINKEIMFKYINLKILYLTYTHVVKVSLREVEQLLVLWKEEEHQHYQ